MEIHYKVMTNHLDYRLEMVRSAQKYGVTEAARLFEVSRPNSAQCVPPEPESLATHEMGRRPIQNSRASLPLDGHNLG